MFDAFIVTSDDWSNVRVEQRLRRVLQLPVHGGGGGHRAYIALCIWILAKRFEWF